MKSISIFVGFLKLSISLKITQRIATAGTRKFRSYHWLSFGYHKIDSMLQLLSRLLLILSERALFLIQFINKLLYILQLLIYISFYVLNFSQIGMKVSDERKRLHECYCKEGDILKIRNRVPGL